MDIDTINKIGTEWAKFKQASGILCDKRVRQSFKGQFYQTVIRPQCSMEQSIGKWKKKRYVDKVRMIGIHMLGWISGLILNDKVRNCCIRGNLKIVPIEDKLRESCLRLFEHVSRRLKTVPVAVERIQVAGTRRRDKQGRTWRERIKKNMTDSEAIDCMVYDGAK